MRLTTDQKAAVLEAGNSLVVACPGSGKTRVLVAKLLRCAHEVEGTARRIACITYTNAAVYEIESRLRAYGTGGESEFCDVSTIHSFCLEHILRHFHWRIPDYREGFSVLPPDDELYREIAEGVCRDHGLRAYPRDRFEQINREADGTPICAPPLNQSVVIDFWSRLQAQGLIDFPNIVFHSLRLLSDWPGIARALSAKFAWVLIDEFQDTSTMQVRIMEGIAKTGLTKFFLVGDPHQSIYRFAGAHPNLMHEFGNQINARQDFRVLVNFRSSKRVIDHAERLCPRIPAMSAGGENAEVCIEPMYYHVPSTFQAMTDYFLPALEA